MDRKKEINHRRRYEKPIVFWEEEIKEEPSTLEDVSESVQEAVVRPAKLPLFKRLIWAIQEFAIQLIVIVVGSILLVVILNVFMTTGFFDQLGGFVKDLFNG